MTKSAFYEEIQGIPLHFISVPPGFMCVTSVAKLENQIQNETKKQLLIFL